MATRLLIDHRITRHPEKAARPDNPIQRKPDWIRVKAPNHPVYHQTRELMRSNDVPRAVILDESVELAKRFGSEDSGAFVNGVLDRIATDAGRVDRDR